MRALDVCGTSLGLKVMLHSPRIVTRISESLHVVPGPGLVFAFALATLYGALFHFIFGGDARRLAVFLLASWIGFAVGHVIGVIAGIELLSLGGLRAAAASGGSLLALMSVRALTTGQRRRRPAR